MARRLAELAALVSGTVVGDPNTLIEAAAPLDVAQAGEIAFLDRADRAAVLSRCNASALLVPLGFVPADGRPVIQVPEVFGAFTQVVLNFRPARVAKKVGISPQAIIAPSAKLGEDVEIHPGAVIYDDVEIGAGSVIHSGVRILAGCKLGEQVTIYPNCVLYEDTLVGARTVLHGGVILGGHGFGYKPENGKHIPAAQLGTVIIGCDVEIGSNSTIDRGTYGATIIGDGTKIDNMVQVAHNCRIGKHNLLCAQVGIAGSVTTGDYVVFAGQCGVRDHLKIGDRAIMGAMSGIMRDVPPDARILGIPATPEKDQMVQLLNLQRLPELRKVVKALEKAVEELQAQLRRQAA